jgi:hypothetical protein
MEKCKAGMRIVRTIAGLACLFTAGAILLVCAGLVIVPVGLSLVLGAIVLPGKQAGQVGAPPSWLARIVRSQALGAGLGGGGQTVETGAGPAVGGG